MLGERELTFLIAIGPCFDRTSGRMGVQCPDCFSTCNVANYCSFSKPWSSSSPCQARRFAFSLGLNHEYLVVKLTHFQRDFVVECAGLASTRFHIRTGDIVLKMIL
jgi:hypothetical protein